MTEFINVVPLITGIYLIIGFLWLKTKNSISTFIFKFIPFLLGLSCIFCSAKLFNWI